MKKEIIVDDMLVGQRFDKVMTQLLDSYTRSQLQMLIKQGQITINEKIHTPHYALRMGDTIQIHDAPIVPDTLLEMPPLEILSVTDDYIVVNKPSGLIVHPSKIHPQHDTLIDAIIAQFPEVQKVGDDPSRPGIIHRLDKDASGVMVIARNQNSFEDLKRQFKTRTVYKEYLILTYGTVEPSEGTIDKPIARSVGHHTKFAAKSNDTGKQAITEYWTICATPQFSLIRVHPLTGRTHQIRVHFHSKGNSLVGDMIYRLKKGKLIASARLMLHARELSFVDLNGEKQVYTCLPDDLFLSILYGCLPASQALDIGSSLS